MSEGTLLFIYTFMPPVIIVGQYYLINFLNQLIATTTGEMSVFSLAKIGVYALVGLCIACTARIQTQRSRKFQILLSFLIVLVFAFLILQYYTPLLPFSAINFLHTNELFIYLFAGAYLSNFFSLLFTRGKKKSKRKSR